jgi:hypothetical protein
MAHRRIMVEESKRDLELFTCDALSTRFSRKRSLLFSPDMIPLGHA